MAIEENIVTEQTSLIWTSNDAPNGPQNQGSNQGQAADDIQRISNETTFHTFLTMPDQEGTTCHYDLEIMTPMEFCLEVYKGNSC